MEIIKLKPVYKDYLWGGDNLKKKFNKDTNTTPLAESWEVSTNKDGESIIDSGEYKGKTLQEYIDIKGRDILGTNSKKYKEFPLLIKFIDAKKNLSVQVHPSDEYARSVNMPYGKTEMWIILECKEGSCIYDGLKKDITKDEYKELIKSGKLLDALNKFEVKVGESYMVPSGTIHAIGAGVTVCEVQQNSNTTYRLYDYDRVDKNGKKRQLHIKEALEVTNLKKYIPKQNKVGNVIQDCEYFRVEEYRVKENQKIELSKESFYILTFVDGNCKLDDKYEVKKGDTYFIPAQNGSINVSGNCKFYLTRV